MGGGSLLLDANETIGRLEISTSGTVSSNSGATLTSTGGFFITGNNSKNVAFNAPIGGGPLSVTGSNYTVVLSASNSFTSGTFTAVNSTTNYVILGDANALGSGTVSLNANSTVLVYLQALAPMTINNPIGPTAGNGVTAFSGSNSITVTNYRQPGLANGATVRNDMASGAVLTLTTVNTDPLNNTGFPHFYLAGTGNTNIGSLTTGTGLGGDFYLSNTGTTTVTGTLGNTRQMYLNTGRLVIGGSGVMVASSGTTYTPAISGTSAILEYASSANSTLSGVISGSVAIVMNGSGTLTLTRNNTP
jgi:hypothetical protein